MNQAQGLIYAALIFTAYFAPTILAPRGRRGSVFTINLFFGWTLVGWVIALFIAMRARENADGGKAGA